MLLTKYYIIIITLKTYLSEKSRQITRSLLHFGTEQELEQGTATGDIAAGDPPSDLASRIPAPNLPTPADGPALSDSTPDGFPPFS